VLELTRVFIFTIALLSTVVAPAQERFSFFQSSTPENVALILKLADLRDDDVIVDHGIPEGSRRKLPWRAARTTASDYFAPIGVTGGDV
jgi:hypothetical protein